MHTFKSYELKIKSRSLALEAELIHRNETKLKKQIERCKAKKAEAEAKGDHQFAADCAKTLNRLYVDFNSLREHRKQIVRPYTRTANLAYGFLRGRSLKEMEPKRHTDPCWDAIQNTILKYGARAGQRQEVIQRFEEWKQAGGKAQP